MRNIGDRINEYDNNLTTVKEFNILFKECPVFGFNDDDILEILGITENATTRMLKIIAFDIEHEFQRKLKSETYVEVKEDIDEDEKKAQWLEILYAPV